MELNAPTRNLALDLVRVTEAAALSAARMMGRGDKIAADQAAVNAMRDMLNTIDIRGRVVIGEGEKDEAPMLFNGEELGTGDGPEMDIAVDPIDGTRSLAFGLMNSISTVALAPKGSMLDPGPFVYMHKLAVGPEASEVIDINLSIKENLHRVAEVKKEDVDDLIVMILDRERHSKIIQEVRDCGARIRLIPDGDVMACLLTAIPDSDVDVYIGVGGTPEGVLAACALRCAGGNIQGKYYVRSDSELEAARRLNMDVNKTLTMNDLVSTDDIFFAVTAITGGYFLSGVDYTADGAATDSLVLRGLTGTRRRVQSNHSLKKLHLITGKDY